MNIKIAKNNNSGITLVALVVTLVILIILATISINAMIGENSLIKKAEQAKQLHENSKVAEDEAMNRLVTEIPNSGTGGSTGGSAGGSTGAVGSAVAVANAPGTYYGKTITGYTGYGKESSGYNWQIYHSDGKNIFITTTDYIKVDDCPDGVKGSKPVKKGDYKVVFSDVLNDYDGTNDMPDTRLKSWLSYITPVNANIKITAYLLDTSIWDNNFKGTKAEYAIGGPTLEMVCASYKKTHPSKYIESQTAGTGYKVKWSDGRPRICYFC